MEYRELFLALFRKFDETKQPRSFLRDLVETAHLFLRMLERFCRGRANLVVQVGCGWMPWGVPEGRAAPPDPILAPPEQTCAEEEEEEASCTCSCHPAQRCRAGAAVGRVGPAAPGLPGGIREGSSPTGGSGGVGEAWGDPVLLQGEVPLPEDVVPFDAASEIPVEEQRAEALLRIQECLQDSRVPQALRLLRSARYHHCDTHPVPRAWGHSASLSPLSPGRSGPKGMCLELRMQRRPRRPGCCGRSSLLPCPVSPHL